MYNDSREIIAEYEAATDARQEYAEARALLPDDISDAAEEMLMRHTDWSRADEEEWQELRTACHTGEAEIQEWSDGTTLILKSDFDGTYAKELCEELGYIDKNWPSFIEVDWEATATNLKQDYTEVELMDESYYVRS